MKAIFTATPDEGRIVWDNRIDVESYCYEQNGEPLLFEVKPLAKTSEKLRLFAFLFGPLMDSAVLGYTFAGYEGMDKVKARYKLQAEFAKEEMYNVKTKQTEIYLLDLSSMTKKRLLKFVQDCVFFIETELKQRVPDSAAYKAMKAGSEFIPISKNVTMIDCEGCGNPEYERNIFNVYNKELGQQIKLCQPCSDRN